MKRFSFLIVAILISLSSLAQSSGRAKSEGSPYDKKTQATIDHFRDIIKRYSKSKGEIQLPTVVEYGGCSSPNKSQSEYDYNRTIESLKFGITKFEKVIEKYSSSLYDYYCEQLQHNRSLLAATMGTEQPKSYECNELSNILKTARNNINMYNKCLENVSNKKSDNGDSKKINLNNKKTYANKEFNKLVASESKKVKEKLRVDKLLAENDEKREKEKFDREEYLRVYGTYEQKQQANMEKINNAVGELAKELFKFDEKEYFENQRRKIENRKIRIANKRKREKAKKETLSEKKFENYNKSGLLVKRSKKGWFGYVNGKGKWIIKAKFIEAKPFKNGKAKVITKFNKQIIINTKGKKIK